MSHHPDWLLIAVGLLLAVAGLLWIFLPGLGWLGHLPGDVDVRRGSFRLYFPLTTCILLSAILTGLLWLVRWLMR